MVRRLGATLDAAARERLGISALHDEQRTAISAAVQGRDTLVVMPTGSGKSAVYQLAGELRPGPTIVVSPLLALQHDQLDSIEENRLSTAAVANSLMPRRAFDAAIERFVRGDVEFLFVAPEQLAKPELLDRLASAHPSLFVVDEAHCISMWGHDFRPEYARLGDAARAVGRPPVLGLTATAAPPVRREIVDRLGMRDALVVTASFDRAELDLRVQTFHEPGAKRDALLSDAHRWNHPAIVYVATHRDAVELAEALEGQGANVAAYYGTLARTKRDAVHEAFRADTLDVVVATNAFGMGIDKSDVRVVAHYDVPGSLDSYYQEIGRGGRDGEPADAVLYYSPHDLDLQRFFAGGSIDEAVIRRVLDATERGAASPAVIATRADASKTQVAIALDRLATVDAVRRVDRGWATVGSKSREEAVQRAVELEAAHHRMQQSRVEMMRAYAETDGCRRVLLLGYYGEAYEPPCGSCDNCRDHDTRLPDDVPFPFGADVVHRDWGHGTVMTATATRVVVLFDYFGYRMLLTDLVADTGILSLVPNWRR